MRSVLVLTLFVLTASTANAQTPKFNEACKAKYPTWASWMGARWTTCTRPPGPNYGEEALKAYNCWCRTARINR